MYVYNRREKKIVTLFKNLKRVTAKASIQTMIIVAAVALSPATLSAFAKGGSGGGGSTTPPTTQPQPNNVPAQPVVPGFYNIVPLAASYSASTSTLKDSITVNNFNGKEAEQFVKLSWGDGTPVQMSKMMDLPGYLKSSRLLTLSNWVNSHTYSSDESHTITIKVYRGDTVGTELYPAESRTVTLQTENTEAICSDGSDNDSDYMVDLSDPDCAQFKKIENTAELCSDGKDNDLNGFIDLKDKPCAPFIPTEDNAVVCSDGIDNDLDGKVDLNDPGCIAFAPPENSPEACTDGQDNDRDGFVDGHDSDCNGLTPPENSPATCTDGTDNDLDGLVDGRDPDCAGQTPTEDNAAVCLDGADNDFDGLFDWNDPDCAPFVIPMQCPVGFIRFFFPGFGFICAASAGY